MGFRIARNAVGIRETVVTENVEKGSIPGNPKILVAYFSHTGNTERAARMIQEKTGSDLHEITMASPYSSSLYEETQKDLYAYHKPELSGTIENMEQYDVILLGYPTWWATMPMPIVSFLEKYDFTGKTIVTFSSHGGGRFGESVSDLSKIVPDSRVGFGFGFHYSGGSTLSDEISEWLKQNNLQEVQNP